jgi:hypothetical protein
VFQNKATEAQSVATWKGTVTRASVPICRGLSWLYSVFPLNVIYLEIGNIFHTKHYQFAHHDDLPPPPPHTHTHPNCIFCYFTCLNVCIPYECRCNLTVTVLFALQTTHSCDIRVGILGGNVRIYSPEEGSSMYLLMLITTYNPEDLWPPWESQPGYCVLYAVTYILF